MYALMEFKNARPLSANGKPFEWRFAGLLIANFIQSSEPSRIEKYLANQRTAQQRDVDSNYHCIYPMLTRENVWIYVIFGYIRNFYH